MSSGAETISREFTIVIDAEPALVWTALTSPEYTTEWWFANTVESTWEVGAPIRYLGEDGLPDVLGEVLVIEPPYRLATTFHPVWSQEVSEHGGTRVDWQLDAFDEPADATCTRVTLTHSGVVAGSVLDRETSPGWNYLLESLKKLLESRTRS
ncbi:SRPBCC domain-containing protein [Herbiconiux sp. CPCC 205763]|uniref:SRPBCC domain-containing protein n=1 Tax=Herbiconiux aconitum TaxID=2970913 RepID=A0ABT2GJX4_9MICO|nr:SRPBCC domain-containing protein [Herbiconiux aconitum]MCS5716519.1 SRPBCC domain-containing protein [Herbiconiux aconitum]